VGTVQGGGGTYNNLFDAHPPFQIDGNFGCTSGIAEMLMQSADGAIHLLPAIPDGWVTGKITGLRALGGFEIMEMQWANSKVTKVVVKSSLGGNLRLRVPNKIALQAGGRMTDAVGENQNRFYDIDTTPAAVVSPKATITTAALKPTILYDIATKAGATYTFISK
jgi:alpha-L-fucosidase 2